VPACVTRAVPRLLLPVRPALLATGLTALSLTAACSAGTAPEAASSTAASSPTAAASAALPSGPPSAAPSSAASSPVPSSTPAVQELELTVAGSKVTGDTGTVDVELGEPVRLTIHSDVSDEVHVHGADVSKDVEAGGTVVLQFTQPAAGRFEVELEGAKRVLTRLQVR